MSAFALNLARFTTLPSLNWLLHTISFSFVQLTTSYITVDVIPSYIQHCWSFMPIIGARKHIFSCFSREFHSSSAQKQRIHDVKSVLVVFTLTLQDQIFLIIQCRPVGMHLVLIRSPILTVYLTPTFSLIGATLTELHNQTRILSCLGLGIYMFYCYVSMVQKNRALIPINHF